MTLEVPGHPNPKPREITLDELREVLGYCTRCPLHEGRTNIVFGSGNPHARVMFVGEAPGKNEDLQGEPFVGKAGQGLEELLGLAGLTRDEVYIANVLKCRPPSNRNPQVDEIDVCSPFLREQIRSVWPDVLVTLGNFATRFVLKTEKGITVLRGHFHDAGHFKVLPMYHPAAAIYDRSKQAALEEDFRLLGETLEQLNHELERTS